MLTPEYIKYEQIKDLAATIQDFQSLITETENAPDDILSDNDKRDIIDGYYRALNDLAAAANQILEEENVEK